MSRGVVHQKRAGMRETAMGIGCGLEIPSCASSWSWEILGKVKVESVHRSRFHSNPALGK